MALKRFFAKAAAKLLLFFELTKYFGKNLQIWLLFQLEREGTDEVSVAEKVDGVESVYRCFQGLIAYSVIRFAGIFDLLGEGIGDLSALEGKEMRFVFADEVTVRIDDAYVEVFESRRAGDIFGDGVVKLQFAHMAHHAGFAVVLIEHRERAGGNLHHRGAGDRFGQLFVERTELRILLFDLLVLGLKLLVLSR